MKRDKNLAVAILLNLFLPGAGYLYMGRTLFGILVLLLVPLLIFATGGAAWLEWAIITAIELQARTKECPKCTESIQPEAQVCRYCQHQLAAAA